MEMLFDGFRDWLLAYGTAGALAWIVLKILAITVPVIVSVAFYVVWGIVSYFFGRTPRGESGRVAKDDPLDSYGK